MWIGPKWVTTAQVCSCEQKCTRSLLIFSLLCPCIGTGTNPAFTFPNYKEWKGLEVCTELEAAKGMGDMDLFFLLHYTWSETGVRGMESSWLTLCCVHSHCVPWSTETLSQPQSPKYFWELQLTHYTVDTLHFCTCILQPSHRYSLWLNHSLKATVENLVYNEAKMFKQIPFIKQLSQKWM